MSAYARFRADIDILEKPKAGSDIRDRYPTDCPVEILEDLGDWLKVKPVRLQYAAPGYVPRVALIFPPVPQDPVFPDLGIGAKKHSSVPPSVKLSEFQAWLADRGKPAWIKEEHWAGLNAQQRTTLLAGMAGSVEANPGPWNSWTAAVAANQRQDAATMEEWIVTLRGGQDVYAIRDHYIYIRPAVDEAYFGCASRGQVMQWTGEVQTFPMGGKPQELKKVRFYRMSRQLDGWFRSDLTQEYIYPDECNDPSVAANGQNIFDLTNPILRHPQDQELVDSKKAGYAGAQYINVQRVTGKSLVHFCLCGEICVAALAARDVIPLLQEWCNPPGGEKNARANYILSHEKEGTWIQELQSLLVVAGLPAGETYSTIPATPGQYKDRLEKGEFAIAGCGINGVGTVVASSDIRHWVVLEDILPVGSSGWVRIYNPFQNREEVYEYNLFMTSVGSGIGLWISLPEPESAAAGGVGVGVNNLPKPQATTPPPS